jgi:hypothetical protein
MHHQKFKWRLSWKIGVSARHLILEVEGYSRSDIKQPRAIIDSNAAAAAVTSHCTTKRRALDHRAALHITDFHQ